MGGKTQGQPDRRTQTDGRLRTAFRLSKPVFRRAFVRQYARALYIPSVPDFRGFRILRRNFSGNLVMWRLWKKGDVLKFLVRWKFAS